MDRPIFHGYTLIFSGVNGREMFYVLSWAYSIDVLITKAK